MAELIDRSSNGTFINEVLVGLVLLTLSFVLVSSEDDVFAPIAKTRFLIAGCFVTCAGKNKAQVLKSGDVIAVNKRAEYSCARLTPCLERIVSRSLAILQCFARAVFTFVDPAAQAAELSRFPQAITDRYVVLRTLGSCASLPCPPLPQRLCPVASAHSLCAEARTARCVWCARAAPAWRVATRSRRSTRSVSPQWCRSRPTRRRRSPRCCRASSTCVLASRVYTSLNTSHEPVCLLPTPYSALLLLSHQNHTASFCDIAQCNSRVRRRSHRQGALRGARAVRLLLLLFFFSSSPLFLLRLLLLLLPRAALDGYSCLCVSSAEGGELFDKLLAIQQKNPAKKVLTEFQAKLVFFQLLCGIKAYLLVLVDALLTLLIRLLCAQCLFTALIALLNGSFCRPHLQYLHDNGIIHRDLKVREN